jgi:hypothetical protein
VTHGDAFPISTVTRAGVCDTCLNVQPVTMRHPPSHIPSGGRYRRSGRNAGGTYALYNMQPSRRGGILGETKGQRHSPTIARSAQPGQTRCRSSRAAHHPVTARPSANRWDRVLSSDRGPASWPGGLLSKRADAAEPPPPVAIDDLVAFNIAQKQQNQVGELLVIGSAWNDPAKRDPPFPAHRPFDLDRCRYGIGVGCAEWRFPDVLRDAQAGCEFERDRVEERSAEGRAANRHGGHLGGSPPFGYRKIGVGRAARLEPEPAQQAPLAEMRSLAAKGLASRAIAAAVRER